MLAMSPVNRQNVGPPLSFRDKQLTPHAEAASPRFSESVCYFGSVTAFLPVPRDDDDPPQADADEKSAPQKQAPIVKLPPKPRAPRKPRVSAAQKAKAAASAEKPAAKSSAEPPAADPGPPPPLPPDLVEDELVIPPRPPLPSVSVAGEDAVELAVPETAEPTISQPEAAEVAEIPEPEENAEPEEIEPEAEVAEIRDTPEPEVEVVEAQVEVLEAEVAEADADRDASAEEDIVALAETLAAASELDAPPAVGVAALSLRGIRKSFGETRAVDDIDLTVPAGTFYGLVGPNGAGKTTTLSMIAGLLQPDRGSIVVGGVDAAAHPLQAKRMLGVLPDRLRTFDRLTGRQLLYYYGVLRGLKPAVVESRTADLARAFDLTDSLGRVVADYSAGMVKKIMLAGAMIHSPRVLVLDEPFEAVDPVSSATILDILSAYVAHGGTVILSSHGMSLVERVCSRVAVLVAGQVLAEGSVEEVRGELTLEQRFVELAGGLSDVEGLEWLHTFSD